MTHAQFVASRVATTDADRAALATIIATNYGAVDGSKIFDSADVTRLVAYRQAVRAGFYNESRA